jgi:hypothetical protein
MTDHAIGIILIASTDIVQVCGRQQYFHVHSLGSSNTFRQTVNPKGVIPVVAAPGGLKIAVSLLFYCV